MYKTIPSYTVSVAGFKFLYPFTSDKPPTRSRILSSIRSGAVAKYFTPNKEWTFDSFKDLSRNSIYFRLRPPEKYERFLQRAYKTDAPFIDFYGNPECWDDSLELRRGETVRVRKIKQGKVIQYIDSECIGNDHYNSIHNRRLAAGYRYVFNKIGVCIDRPYENNPIPSGPGTIPGYIFMWGRENSPPISSTLCLTSLIGGRLSMVCQNRFGIEFSDFANYLEYQRKSGVMNKGYIPIGVGNIRNIRGFLKKAQQNQNIPKWSQELLSLKPQIEINSTTNILTWKLPKLNSVL